MPFLKNVSPYGDLDIPLVRRTIVSGEVFEVTDAQAACLAGQTDNYLPVDANGDPLPAVDVPADGASDGGE